MAEDPPKPELTPDMQALMESSDCQLVLVGGMRVGHHVGDRKWVIRSKYCDGVIEQNAKYSQQLAAKARRIHALEQQLAAEVS